ncbi:MAG TPA: hypothetical protein VFB25_07080 [Gaiellaceae bacterium]|nr:hypothetical protein [Gaiellaceae bacterium]
MLVADAPRFYDLAAETIPVLFIAGLVGQNWATTPKTPHGTRVVLMALGLAGVALAFFAELAALHTVATGKVTEASRVLVLYGLVIFGFVLLATVFFRLFFALFPDSSLRARAWSTFGLIVVLVVLSHLYLG